jgi:hypothetical protein
MLWEPTTARTQQHQWSLGRAPLATADVSRSWSCLETAHLQCTQQHRQRSLRPTGKSTALRPASIERAPPSPGPTTPHWLAHTLLASSSVYSSYNSNKYLFYTLTWLSFCATSTDIPQNLQSPNYSYISQYTIPLLAPPVYSSLYPAFTQLLPKLLWNQ